MDSHNQTEQIAELKALRQHYRGIAEDDDADKFEFLGPKVSQATVENPTRMEITCERHDLRVMVTLPADYPSQSPPIFEVNQLGSRCAMIITPAHADAIKELLDEQASYMPGMACVATSLFVLDDLDLTSLDLGQPGQCRSIFKVDVVNNSKQFTKSLKSAANGNPCVYFYRTIECQNNAKFSFAVDPWRAVYCLCDAPNKSEAVDFMKTIRTDGAMDMDMLGKPGKIQLTVIEEFEMKPKAKNVNCNSGLMFEGFEYRTDEDLDELMDPFLAAAAGV
ncbi:hypothetical protein ACHAXR_001063 [Thalassiosira sp. AJA248-18]